MEKKMEDGKEKNNMPPSGNEIQHQQEQECGITPQRMEELARLLIGALEHRRYKKAGKKDH